MTPDRLAALHARCFVAPPPWPAPVFAAMLDDPTVHLVADPMGRGFALLRVVADEAELLTLAVDPDDRRKGVARALLAGVHNAAAARGAGTAFLEVAADNLPARALYAAAGWVQAGLRPGYYRAPHGNRVDALILRRTLG